MPSINGGFFFSLLGETVLPASKSFATYFSFHSIRDRRKLTFYFVADKRIDFRELVRELFRYALGLFAR